MCSSRIHQVRIAYDKGELKEPKSWRKLYIVRFFFFALLCHHLPIPVGLCGVIPPLNFDQNRPLTHLCFCFPNHPGRRSFTCPRPRTKRVKKKRLQAELGCESPMPTLKVDARSGSWYMYRRLRPNHPRKVGSPLAAINVGSSLRVLTFLPMHPYRRPLVILDDT